jgi:hypothetical protein
LHIPCEEYVLALQISMEDLVGMAMLEGERKLAKPVKDLA